jgi:A/G-specific adenine glycosylase
MHAATNSCISPWNLSESHFARPAPRAHSPTATALTSPDCTARADGFIDMTYALPPLATCIVRWQAQHGRNHLPWQNTRDPYRVWLSEIMLQQTQVTTVLGYYERFLATLPDVASLAAAPADQVMALWSGLGYYSRARNLHRCAQVVMAEHGGQFPRCAQALAQLPGIGRSTAAAIAAFCFEERAAILDANVKRVLTRVLAFEGDLAQARQEKILWALAEQLLPTAASDMPRYTQALMDLGATVCVPRSPSCLLCPLQTHCQASKQGRAQEFPIKTRKTVRRSQSWWLLFLRTPHNQYWLQRRSAQSGANAIWAGLYSPLVYASADELDSVLVNMDGFARTDLPVLQHGLTHRELHLHPVVLHVTQAKQHPLPHNTDGAWWSLSDALAQGLPAPIRKLLADVAQAGGHAD